MRDAINLKPDLKQLHESSVIAIANETATSTDIVKTLYEEELTALSTRATVKQYIGVIVAKRVKQQLRVLASSQQ